jgi:predicted nucleic acid-binding protein
MIHGLDTGFLIAAEVVEHPQHVAARETLARLIAADDRIAIAPQVLAEFIHVATDQRRSFSRLISARLGRSPNNGGPPAR